MTSLLSSEADAALLTLGRSLRARGYAFTPSTPATHARVLGRDPARLAGDLREVLGYSRVFARGLDREVEALLDRAGMLEVRADGSLRSLVRCARVDDAMYFHSAFPTDGADAVFFGPDTVRFIALLRRWLHRESLGRVVDVGAGSGAGGLSLAAAADAVVLADINESALRLARVNAALNDVSATVVHSDVLAGVSGRIDTVVTNPPYLVDAKKRAYRDGGARGIELALRIARESVARLAPGGRLVLYTGSPVVDGRDLFVDAARDELAGCRSLQIEELDPDVFGEELDEPAYGDVERIALIGLCARV